MIIKNSKEIIIPISSYGFQNSSLHSGTLSLLARSYMYYMYKSAMTQSKENMHGINHKYLLDGEWKVPICCPKWQIYETQGLPFPSTEFPWLSCPHLPHRYRICFRFAFFLCEYSHSFFLEQKYKGSVPNINRHGSSSP